jgi:BASS family bile acid:Na+ symporter
MISKFVNLYPLWIVLASVVGMLHPPAFLWFSGRWVESAIALVMLGMGFTLTLDDFRRLLKMPGSFALGFICQYTAMPLLGWGVGKVLHLEPGFAAGLILVAACPGGVASNLISYLARANVALSVVLTMASTLTAFVMTPLWCKALAGAYVEVDALGICLSTLRAVVAPVLIGVFCNWKFPRLVAKAGAYGPLVSVVSIIFIAGSIVAPNAEKVIANAGQLTLALVLLHGLGFAIGYWVSRLLGYHDEVARTVSIEVGMQNGGMAAMLAKNHFAANPLVGVPAVFCSVLQSLLGSFLAAYWRFRPLK